MSYAATNVTVIVDAEDEFSARSVEDGIYNVDGLVFEFNKGVQGATILQFVFKSQEARDNLLTKLTDIIVKDDELPPPDPNQPGVG